MKNKFVLAMFIMILNCFSLDVLSATQDLYPFTSAQQAQRFQQLTEQLRCLVCQNESLADSNAGLAQDLRKDVYTMVLAGKSNQQIKDYLVDRYGNFILFKPPVNSSTYVLWFIPFFILIIAMLIVVLFINKRKAPTTLSEEDKVKIKNLLNNE